VTFEYDPKKSEANKAKHGIDFEEAKALWDDPNLLVVDSQHSSENRKLGVAQLSNKFWSAIFTMRGENVRLISVRRDVMKKLKDTAAISAEELDRKFDDGENVSEHFDWKNATRPNLEIKRVNIDLPNHFLIRLDRESALRGITRQSLIKVWLYERLEEAEKK
jgi:uncharacterized DUF497 family protein